MQGFMIALLTCSVSMSAVALFYMAITPLLQKRYSERGRYYAWLIVVTGLIIPFRPQWDNTIAKVNVQGEVATPVIQIGNTTPFVLSDVNTITPALPSISWWQIAAAVWFAGLVITIAYHVIRHCRSSSL